MNNQDQHLEGFNDGYTIQKYEPELAKQMLANLDKVKEPYIKGFFAGAKEYQMEIELDKSNLYPGVDQYFDLDTHTDKEINKEDDMDIDV